MVCKCVLAFVLQSIMTLEGENISLEWQVRSSRCFTMHYDLDIILHAVFQSIMALWRSVALCGSLWRSVALCGALWRFVALFQELYFTNVSQNEQLTADS